MKKLILAFLLSLSFASSALAWFDNDQCPTNERGVFRDCDGD